MANGVAGFAVFAGLILVLAALPSRLLGVRFSLGRAVLTGSAGLAAGFGVGYLVTRRQPGITPLVVVSAAVATMVLTVVAALLSRSGGRFPNGRPVAAVAGAGVDGAQHAPLPATGPDRDSSAATTVSTIVATAADTTTCGVIPG